MDFLISLMQHNQGNGDRGGSNRAHNISSKDPQKFLYGTLMDATDDAVFAQKIYLKSDKKIGDLLQYEPIFKRIIQGAARDNATTADLVNYLEFIYFLLKKADSRKEEENSVTPLLVKIISLILCKDQSPRIRRLFFKTFLRMDLMCPQGNKLFLRDVSAKVIAAAAEAGYSFPTLVLGGNNEEPMAAAGNDAMEDEKEEGKSSLARKKHLTTPSALILFLELSFMSPEFRRANKDIALDFFANAKEIFLTGGTKSIQALSTIVELYIANSELSPEVFFEKMNAINSSSSSSSSASSSLTTTLIQCSILLSGTTPLIILKGINDKLGEGLITTTLEALSTITNEDFNTYCFAGLSKTLRGFTELLEANSSLPGHVRDTLRQKATEMFLTGKVAGDKAHGVLLNILETFLAGNEESNARWREDLQQAVIAEASRRMKAEQATTRDGAITWNMICIMDEIVDKKTDTFKAFERVLYHEATAAAIGALPTCGMEYVVISMNRTFFAEVVGEPLDDPEGGRMSFKEPANPPRIPPQFMPEPGAGFALPRHLKVLLDAHRKRDYGFSKTVYQIIWLHISWYVGGSSGRLLCPMLRAVFDIFVEEVAAYAAAPPEEKGKLSYRGMLGLLNNIYIPLGGHTRTVSCSVGDLLANAEGRELLSTIAQTLITTVLPTLKGNQDINDFELSFFLASKICTLGYPQPCPGNNDGKTFNGYPGAASAYLEPIVPMEKGVLTLLKEGVALFRERPLNSSGTFIGQLSFLARQIEDKSKCVDDLAELILLTTDFLEKDTNRSSSLLSVIKNAIATSMDVACGLEGIIAHAYDRHYENFDITKPFMQYMNRNGIMLNSVAPRQTKGLILALEFMFKCAESNNSRIILASKETRAHRREKVLFAGDKTASEMEATAKILDMLRAKSPLAFMCALALSETAQRVVTYDDALTQFFMKEKSFLKSLEVLLRKAFNFSYGKCTQKFLDLFTNIFTTWFTSISDPATTDLDSLDNFCLFLKILYQIVQSEHLPKSLARSWSKSLCKDHDAPNKLVAFTHIYTEKQKDSKIVAENVEKTLGLVGKILDNLWENRNGHENFEGFEVRRTDLNQFGRGFPRFGFSGHPNDDDDDDDEMHPEVRSTNDVHAERRAAAAAADDDDDDDNDDFFGDGNDYNGNGEGEEETRATEREGEMITMRMGEYDDDDEDLIDLSSSSRSMSESSMSDDFSDDMLSEEDEMSEDFSEGMLDEDEEEMRMEDEEERNPSNDNNNLNNANPNNDNANDGGNNFNNANPNNDNNNANNDVLANASNSSSNSIVFREADFAGVYVPRVNAYPYANYTPCNFLFGRDRENDPRPWGIEDHIVRVVVLNELMNFNKGVSGNIVSIIRNLKPFTGRYQSRPDNFYSDKLSLDFSTIPWREDVHKFRGRYHDIMRNVVLAFCKKENEEKYPNSKKDVHQQQQQQQQQSPRPPLSSPFSASALFSTPASTSASTSSFTQQQGLLDLSVLSSIQIPQISQPQSSLNGMDVELSSEELAILEEIPEELREEAIQEIIENRNGGQQQSQQPQETLPPPPPPPQQQQQQQNQNQNQNTNELDDIELELLDFPEEMRPEIREQMIAARRQNGGSANGDFMEMFNQMDPITQDELLADASISDLPESLRERASKLQESRNSLFSFSSPWRPRGPEENGEEEIGKSRDADKEDKYDCFSPENALRLVKYTENYAIAIYLIRMAIVHGSKEFTMMIIEMLVKESTSGEVGSKIKYFACMYYIIKDRLAKMLTREQFRATFAEGINLLSQELKFPREMILRFLSRLIKNTGDPSLDAEVLTTAFTLLTRKDPDAPNAKEIDEMQFDLTYNLLRRGGATALEGFMNVANLAVESLCEVIRDKLPKLTPALGAQKANDIADGVDVTKVLFLLKILVLSCNDSKLVEHGTRSIPSAVYHEEIINSDVVVPAPASLRKLFAIAEEFLVSFNKAREIERGNEGVEGNNNGEHGENNNNNGERADNNNNGGNAENNNNNNNNNGGNAENNNNGGNAENNNNNNNNNGEHGNEGAEGNNDRRITFGFTDGDGNPAHIEFIIGPNDDPGRSLLNAFQVASLFGRMLEMRSRRLRPNIKQLVELLIFATIFFTDDIEVPAVEDSDGMDEPQAKKIKISVEPGTRTSTSTSTSTDDDDDGGSLLRTSSNSLMSSSSSLVGSTISEKRKAALARFLGVHDGLIKDLKKEWESGKVDSICNIIILFAPEVLDFELKYKWFRNKVSELKAAENLRYLCNIRVNRDSIFEDSFRGLYNAGPKILKSQLSVTFVDKEGRDEGAMDAGGPKREWYTEISRHIVNPEYGLFKKSDDGAVQPNPESGAINPNHLDYFRFVGNVVGKALWDGELLNAHFTRGFYKQMLGRKVTMRDMEALDSKYYDGLMELHNGNADDFGVTFSLESNLLGVTKTIDLIPNGRDIDVTNENKDEYIRLVVNYRLVESIKRQMGEFMKGLSSLIPPALLRPFDEKQIEMLISGLPKLDLEDLKKHSVFEIKARGLDDQESHAKYSQWFWRAVESFTPEERVELIQFVTGTSSVPVNGFSELQAANRPFHVEIFGQKDHLPISHTCFNTIEIPPYDSYEELREKLYTAVKYGHSGFGFK